MIAPAKQSEERTSYRAASGQAVWTSIALLLLIAPLFGHGCHGDDIDHEPLVVPARTSSERQ